MFDAIRKLMGGAGAPKADDGQAVEIAIAGLLVEAARADDKYTADERRLIEGLLVGKFNVDAEKVVGLLDAAERKQAEAIDLYTFVRDAKALGYAEKVQLVESLWRVILTDGLKDAWEDMLVRRVCGLLHVEDVDSGLARKRVELEIEEKRAGR